VSPQEIIRPANSPHEDFEVSGKGLEFGAAIDERDHHLEATQSSVEGGSEESPSQGRCFSMKYRSFVYIFIWLVMTG
jgi:hypothetical protein